MSRWQALPARTRTVLQVVGWSAAVLFATQIVMPGPKGVGGHGTPTATLFFGVVEGLVAALCAAAIVIVHRTMRIVNFAATSLGIAGAFLFFGLAELTKVPFLVSFPAGLLVATLVGTVAGLVLLRFFNSSRLVLTIVTAIGTLFVVGLSTNIYNLPFFPDERNLTLTQKTGAEPLHDYLPFAGWHFHIGKSPIPFGFAEVFTIEMAVITLLALGAFLRYTRAGVALRGLSENPERASLLGIGVGGMSIVVWSIAGLLSGETTMLTGMLDRPSSAAAGASGLLLAGFAAAVLARMDKLATAVFAAIGIEIISEAWKTSYPNDQRLVDVALFLVLAVALLVQSRKSTGRAEMGASVTWAAVQEQRGIPKVLRDVPIVRAARWSLFAIFLTVLIVLPFVVSKGLLLTAGATLLGAIVTMSIVVITGWGGQVSLAQWAFAAVGAVVAGALTATVGVSFWIAVPLATVVAGAFAALVGLPALRVKGLLLLPLSYAFAIAVQVALFQDRYFGWLLPTKPIDRPTLFFIDFRDDVSMYFLCVACLVLAIVVVGNLRRSRTGRILIALRDNDTGAEAFGIPVARTKLLAFAIAGAMAGFAGAVFVHQQQGLNGLSFEASRSVTTFTAAVFGGIGSIGGALLGTLWFAVFDYLSVNELVQTFVANGGPLYVLLMAPAGLISIVNLGRDSILRVIAQRRQIVVPSLFADYDPDALERRQIPLRGPETHSGLAALPAAARFGLSSHLYPPARGGEVQ